MCQELVGVVRGCQGLSGVARGCQELPGVARSSHEDVLEAVRNCKDVTGVTSYNNLTAPGNS